MREKALRKSVGGIGTRNPHHHHHLIIIILLLLTVNLPLERRRERNPPFLVAYITPSRECAGNESKHTPISPSRPATLATTRIPPSVSDGKRFSPLEVLAPVHLVLGGPPSRARVRHKKSS